jgi:spore germination cell wall hydrolase CwlJ-like protein
MARTWPKRKRGLERPAPRAFVGLVLLLGASCVPAAPEARLALGAPSPLPEQASIADAAAPQDLSPIPLAAAAAANAALELSDAPNPPARSVVLRAGNPIDQARSLDCLAQAIYYEARSEGEDGQRAVAQVVLNRVRHPAWPNSVCGVVYQGPMRAGGGCQFTFTCDGSLAAAAAGPAWARARRLAAEALAGKTFPGVGHSTHYHTHAVFPHWAPRLWKTAVIGSHNFYRLPGAGGLPQAFVQAYAGREPAAAPALVAAPEPPRLAVAPVASAPRSEAEVRAVVALPSDIPADTRWVAADLPESRIREPYRNSGRWRTDAPGH